MHLYGAYFATASYLIVRDKIEEFRLTLGIKKSLEILSQSLILERRSVGNGEHAACCRYRTKRCIRQFKLLESKQRLLLLLDEENS